MKNVLVSVSICWRVIWTNLRFVSYKIPNFRGFIFLYINDIHIVILVEVLTHIDTICPYPKQVKFVSFNGLNFNDANFD